MSDRLPVVKPKDVIRSLQKAGWNIHRQKGRHVIMTKVGTGSLVVVPSHAGDMPKGTLRGILDDAGMSADDFKKLL